MVPFYYLCLFFMFIFGMLSSVPCSLVTTPAGKGLTSCISCVLCFLVFLSLFHMVFWIRYGTSLNKFLIFTFLSTLTHKERGGSVVEY